MSIFLLKKLFVPAFLAFPVVAATSMYYARSSSSEGNEHSENKKESLSPEEDVTEKNQITLDPVNEKELAKCTIGVEGSKELSNSSNVDCLRGLTEELAQKMKDTLGNYLQ